MVGCAPEDTDQRIRSFRSGRYRFFDNQAEIGRHLCIPHRPQCKVWHPPLKTEKKIDAFPEEIHRIGAESISLILKHIHVY